MEPGFQGPLVVEYIDGVKWLLHENFGYVSSRVAPGELFEAPRGFYTDFASVPSFLHSVVSPTGRHGKSAVIHDLVYFSGYKNSRLLCDMLLDEAMGFEKEGSILRPIIYHNVRAFGWRAWNNHRASGHNADVLEWKIRSRSFNDVRGVRTRGEPVILTIQ